MDDLMYANEKLATCVWVLKDHQGTRLNSFQSNLDQNFVLKDEI